MPDPISPSNPPLSSGYDSTLDEQGQICRPDPLREQAAGPQPEPAPAPPPAVSKLLGAVPTPPSALPPPPAKPLSPPAAHNNAERTSAQPGIAPYLSAGRVGDTYALYAGAALLKGHDPKSGLDVEVLSVSAQVGTQEEWQAALVRLGGASSSGSASVEAMTMRVSRGIHNDDGSVGLNLGAQATAIGAEGTYGKVDSVTVGLSAGVGAAGSVGVRDLDADGKHEVCAKASYGPFTLGVCVEAPF
jgi:hypothetical protein